MLDRFLQPVLRSSSYNHSSHISILDRITRLTTLTQVFLLVVKAVIKITNNRAKCNAVTNTNEVLEVFNKMLKQYFQLRGCWKKRSYQATWWLVTKHGLALSSFNCESPMLQIWLKLCLNVVLKCFQPSRI